MQFIKEQLEVHYLQLVEHAPNKLEMRISKFDLAVYHGSHQICRKA